MDLVPFRPHPLLRGRHAQTIAAALLPARHPGGERRHEAHLPDGDRLVLHEDCPAEWRPGDPAVLLVHGLCGSHRSPSLIRLAVKLAARGVRVFRKTMRGYGEGVRLARHPLHVGRADDVAACLEWVRAAAPGSPLATVGFSLGGNLVFWLLAERPDLARELTCAAAVCPPIDLVCCARKMRRGFNRFYDWSFMRDMLRLLAERRRSVPDLVDLPVRGLPQRLREFDDVYMAPLLGYRGAHDYYTQISPASRLADVSTPTLLLAAEDDPIVPVEMFQRAPLSSAIRLHVTPRGGHLGFLSARGNDPDWHWVDWRLLDWLQGHLAPKGASVPPPHALRWRTAEGRSARLPVAP